MSSLLKLLTAFFSIILHDPPPHTRRGRFPAIRRHAWLRGGGGGGHQCFRQFMQRHSTYHFRALIVVLLGRLSLISAHL